jgi:hypothetical protein
MTYALKYYRRIKVNIFMQNLKFLHTASVQMLQSHNPSASAEEAGRSREQRACHN